MGGRKDGEKHQCVVDVVHAPPTGDLAQNPGLCSDWESSPWPFSLQDNTQPMEPHQLGQSSNFLTNM